MASRYVIKIGDSTDSVAFAHGHFPEAVWQHAENDALRARRPSRNVLAPGDELYIPDLRPGSAQAATGKRHVFRRRGVPARLRLQLFEQERPLAGVEYTLRLPGGQECSGAADGDGVLEVWVPPDLTRATLVYGKEGRTATLELGHLDPLTELRGQQQRLNNLGFPCGRADGVLDEATGDAVRSFQLAAGRAPTGELDDGTLAALADIHDGAGKFPPRPAPPIA